MQALTCGFIGLGLIGGSIAKAMKKYDKSIRILAYDINPAGLLQAKNEGVLDDICDSVCDSKFHACDYLFLCAPVSENDKNLSALKDVLSPSCILTDVGSVKVTTHQTIKALGLDKFFIGGHPMAGSEKTGYDNSDELLLQNAYYILTPTDTVSREKLMQYEAFVMNFGAIPLVLDEEKHDYITAAVSHLPHIVAAQLVNLIHDSDGAEGLMKLIAAGGFKDITRIASSSPDMWKAICMTNTENIISLLDAYIKSMEAAKSVLVSKDESNIRQMFADAKDYRDGFISASRGPIKKVYRVHLAVPDEAGVIARVATLLADANINIQNIGIMHNREFEDGALRVEFYDEPSLKKAHALLLQNKYTIYSTDQ